MSSGRMSFGSTAFFFGMVQLLLWPRHLPAGQSCDRLQNDRPLRQGVASVGQCKEPTGVLQGVLSVPLDRLSPLNFARLFSWACLFRAVHSNRGMSLS